MWALILVFSNGLSMTVPLDVRKQSECMAAGKTASAHINDHVSDNDAVTEYICTRRA